MYRNAMQVLGEWKNSPSRKPLLLYGARQVGKSYLLDRFAKENFADYVILDLEKSPNFKAAFEGDLAPRVVLSNLSRIIGAPLHPGMLIVLDEIQASSRAVTSLKYFHEQMPECPVIGSGSLLGVSMNQDAASYPVGKVTTVTLHPMTFDEFLIALGRGQMLEGIRESYASGKAFPLHDQAMDLYRAYLLVGGMPEAVKAYRDADDLRAVARIHHDILNLYLADMAKYASNKMDVARARGVWESVPAQLAKPNRKFQYKVVRKGARSSQYAGALDWLMSAGLVTRCARISSGEVPLRLQEDPDAFKVYASDTGLLSTRSEIPPAALFEGSSRRLLDLGGITENYVVQQLAARGISARYWTSGNTAEVDLVIEDGSVKAVPVEVKSSENVRSRGLSEYRKKYQPQRCVRLSAKNFARDGAVESVPLYAAGAFFDDVLDSRSRYAG